MENNETEKKIDTISETEADSENLSSPEADSGSVIADILHVLGFQPTSRNTVTREQTSQVEDTNQIERENQSCNSVIGGEPINRYPDTEAVFSAGPAELVPVPDELNKRNMWSHYMLFLLICAVLLAGGLSIYRNFDWVREPNPPAEDVVATYNGKNITTKELMDFIAVEGSKEREHLLCPNHGYDHSKCMPEEACEAHPIDSLEGYQAMVTRLAVEQMILDWADTQGITQRDDVRHEMEDLLNDAAVEQYISQLHETNITTESISSWDVQQYYSENQEQFQGQTLAEAEAEIRQILAAEKDKSFFSDYIEDLKKTAGLQVNFEVLKTAAPSKAEINAYYTKNLERYRTPETITYSEIRLRNASESTDAARKLRSGESFESVAAMYGKDGTAQTVTMEKGGGESAIEDVLWKMQPNEVSDPLTDSNGSVSIIKLLSKEPAGYQPLSEVETSIESILLRQIMDEEYTIRKSEMLFSVHSRRYTLGEFYTEYRELSEVYQEALSTYEAKKQFVEQMIVMELLLEESGDKSATNDSDAHDMEELRVQYLWQILHQEEVDDDLDEPTEEEIRDFYEKNPAKLMTPASAEISLIWIDQGANTEKKEQAKAKAEDAMSLLNSGTSFAEVAKMYSEDSSAEDGGVISGPLYESHLAAELAGPIFSLKVGQVSKIIDYRSGYYIIQVRSRTEARLPELEEVSHTISDYLKEMEHETRTQQMEQQLLKEAGFTIYDKTLRGIMKAQQNNMGKGA